MAGVILNRRSVLLVLISVEVILLAVNIKLISNSIFFDDLIGQVFSLFVLTVAAAESAIGLAILVAYYRVRNTIAVEDVSMLRA